MCIHSKAVIAMNHIYRIVWNKSKRIWQVASEFTKGGQGKTRSNRSLSAIAAGTLFWISIPLHAASLPTNGQVVAGQGTIQTSGNSLTINQHSQNVAINWQDFSIAEGHTVNFVQPNAQSAALNRVTGNQVSEIRGALNANGRVFLVNPNGIMFSDTARVDVGSLVASTLNISTEDFMAGNYNFAGSSANAVINQGNIQTAQGGMVAMIAARIINTGNITTPSGSTVMGAGSRVTLDMGGPVKIEVLESQLATYIEQGGAIRADGGLVYLTAKAANALTASVINHTGITQAQTLTAGADGRIMLMGDMDRGVVQVAGTLDASAPSVGNGGFIETSAAQVQVADVKVSTRAAKGKTGDWLIDPVDITIAASGGNITGAAIATALQTTNVTLDTSGADSCTGASCADLTGTNGDIFVKDDIKVTSGDTDSTLTLKANRNIIVDAGKEISSTSGKLNTVLWADSDANADGMIWIGQGNTNTPSQTTIINSNGGDITLSGGADLTTGFAKGNAVNANGITLDGTQLLSNGGNILLRGKSAAEATSIYFSEGNAFNSDGVRLHGGNTLDSGSGTINIWGESVGTTGSGNGVEFSNLGTATDLITSSSTSNEAIVIEGKGGNANLDNSWGIYTSSGTIQATNGGGIKLVGSGQKKSGLGIATGSHVLANSGKITLVGVGSGSEGHDVLIQGNVGQKTGSAIETSSSGISITADTLKIDNAARLASTGALEVRTRSNGRKINIGGVDDSSSLNIDSSYFTNNFVNGFSKITVGDSNSDTLTVDAALAYQDDLILKSGTNIVVKDGGIITGTVGENASLTLWARAGGNQDASDGYSGGVWLQQDSKVNTNGGNITIGGGSDPLIGYAKGIGGYSAEGNASTRGVTINGTLAAAGGDISIRGRGQSGGYSRGVSIAGKISTTGVGKIDIHGIAQGGSDAVAIGDATNAISKNAGSVSSVNGAISITGQQGTGKSINLNNSSNITSQSLVVLNGLSAEITSDINDYITADSLLVLNSNKVTLNSASNNVENLAASNVGSFSFIDQNQLAISSINWNTTNYRGIQANGDINIATLTGNLTLNDSITTTATAPSAITLNAGKTASAGDAAGGNIIIEEGAIETGAGGRATLYTGSITGSNGITSLHGAGSGQYRYNSDEVNTNYTAGLNTGIYGIYREQPTISVGAQTKNITYGDTLPTSYTANYTGLVNGDSSDILTGSATWLTAVGTNSTSGNRIVGSYDASYSGGLSNALGYNVADNTDSVGELIVEKRAINVSGITANNKTYDGTTTASVNTTDAQVAGLITGDDVAVSASGSFTDKNAGISKTVTLANASTGADADNYTFSFNTATANIDKKAITIGGITAADKTYDATTNATVNAATAEGWLAGDDVSVSATGIFVDKNAEADKTVALTSSYAGADVDNYVITDQAMALANIAKKAITIDGITANNKTYDASTDATVNTSSANGWIAGDDVTVSTTGVFSDKQAGAGKTVALASRYAGADVDNYVITDQAMALANIAKKAITISGITANNKTYDASTDATVNITTANGWIAGDDVTVSASGIFNDKNAGNNKAVSLTSRYAGADVSNYDITSQANTTANITPRSVTVTADKAGKYQGAPDPALTYQTGCGQLNSDCGLVNGELLSGTLTRKAGEQAGNYAIQQGTVTNAVNPNYAINFEPGNFVVKSNTSNNENSVAISALQQLTQEQSSGRSQTGVNQRGMEFAASYRTSSSPSTQGSEVSAGLELVELDEATIAEQSTQQQNSNLLPLFVVNGGIRIDNTLNANGNSTN